MCMFRCRVVRRLQKWCKHSVGPCLSTDSGLEQSLAGQTATGMSSKDRICLGHCTCCLSVEQAASFCRKLEQKYILLQTCNSEKKIIVEHRISITIVLFNTCM
jgi:hypothetical protein